MSPRPGPTTASAKRRRSRPRSAGATLGEVLSPVLGEDGLDLNATLESVERRLIYDALQRTGGNRNRAAALLKIRRTTLVEKLKRLGEPDNG